MAILTCDNCSSSFTIKKVDRRQKQYFCSKSCGQEYRRNHPRRTGEIVPCAYCEQLVYRRPCQRRRSVQAFCSRVCQGKWHAENLVGEKASNYKDKLITTRCMVCQAEFSYYPTTKRIAKYCSQKCKSQAQSIEKIQCLCANCKVVVFVQPYRLKWSKARGRGLIFCNKKCRVEFLRGNNHPGWIAGRMLVKDTNHSIRQSYELKAWRKAVFVRDGFACQNCGASRCNLNAHHKKPYRRYPELIFDPNNGITLCIPCHRLVHGKTPTQEKITPIIAELRELGYKTKR